MPKFLRNVRFCKNKIGREQLDLGYVYYKLSGKHIYFNMITT